MGPLLLLWVIIFSPFLKAKAENTKIPGLISPQEEKIQKEKGYNLLAPNQFFSGRSRELSEMAKAFSHFKEVVLSIVGISGIGKTQLAKQYAYSSLKNYELIWWFNAEKNMDMQADELLKKVCQENKTSYYRPINSADLAKKLQRELEILKLNFLFIFDNVDDLALVKQYTPANGKGSFLKHIIVTSTKMNKTRPVFVLNKFQREESISFLSKILKEEKISELNRLAETLGDFPLALVQATSYIKANPSVDVKAYLQIFKENHAKLWESEEKLIQGKNTDPSLQDNYNKTMATAIKMNVNSIRNSSPLAYEILSFCSLLNFRHIPFTMLEGWAREKHGASKIEFHEALSVLLNNFLLEKEARVENPTDSGMFTQHELIQKIIEDDLPKEVTKRLLQEAADALLQDLIHSPGTLFEQFRSKEPLYNHIEKICALAEAFGDHSNTLNELKIAILYFIHFIQRDFDRSAPLIKTLEELIQKEKGLNPLAYLWFYCVLGNDQIYENFPKAQQAYKQALPYLDKIKDKEAQRSYLLQISSNYVESLSNFGRIKEAISLCDSLKDPLEKVENKSQKIVFLGVSAALRLKYGQYDQSLADIAQSVVLISEQNKDEQLIALLMFIKANCLLYKNQPKEAFELIQKYYPYLLEIFSTPECMVLVKGQFVRGACLASFGKLDEALSLVQHTLKSYESSTGFENDSLKGMGYRILGEIFEAKGNLPQAFESYRKAETLYDSILQEKSLDDLSLLYMRLAILGAKQGDEGIVKKYLSLHIDAFGLAHPRTLEIKKHLDSKGLPLP